MNKKKFRINGGINFYFACWGVIIYLSVASFCSSFYSTLGETKGVNFCNFVTKFNQAYTKYSVKCIQQLPYDPHTWSV